MEKFSDQVDTFMGVCHHFVRSTMLPDMVETLPGSLMILILITCKHNKGM